jgi:hypothetical protein
MPKGHQEYADWTPERLIRWAAMTEAVLASRRHPQQAFRSAMGLIRLAKVYTLERLETACDLAMDGQATSYKSVKSILTTGLDQQPRNIPCRSPHRLLMTIFAAAIITIEEERHMLHHPTLEKLQTLRLAGMLKALNEQQQMPDINSLGFEERLGLLIDREVTERENRRLEIRLKKTRLRHSCSVEDLDFKTSRGLDKR